MSNQVATTGQQRGVEMLKGILNAPSVQEQFKNALKENSGTFVASIIDLYNGDTNLQKCEPKDVVMECLKAAVLHLPLNKALGFSYVIPFNNSKNVNGQWIQVMMPTFQIGYKGYVQLAQRTDKYRTINADIVYEGEVRKVNKLTGEISFDGDKVSDTVIGYFAYFELLNGFSKTLYMTVEQMSRHAKAYSKGIKKDVTTEHLISLANAQTKDSKAVGWLGNFHEMAKKTVLRLLISKFGYLSIEMQNAIVSDISSDNSQEVRDDAVNSSDAKSISIDADFEEVKDEAPAQDEAPY